MERMIVRMNREKDYRNDRFYYSVALERVEEDRMKNSRISFGQFATKEEAYQALEEFRTHFIKAHDVFKSSRGLE